MNDHAYYARLAGDIDEWRESGLIDVEQAGALKSWASLRATETAAPFGALSLMAAAAFIVGALSILAANWARMPDLVQFVAVLAVFNGALMTAGWLLRAGRDTLGHAAALAAAAMFGGALVLIGQSFNIQGAPEGLLFVWTIGAAMVAVALRSGPALGLAAALALAWMLVRLAAAPHEILLLPPPERGEPIADAGFWLTPLAAAGIAALAWRWRLAVAWHAVQLLAWAWIAVLVGDALSVDADGKASAARFGVALLMIASAAAAAGLALRARGAWGASAVAGYAVAVALAAGLFSASMAAAPGVYAAVGAHLVGAIGVVVAGAYLRHRWIMALGVAGFLAGVGYLYLSIGGSLLLAGLVLLVVAAGIGGLGWMLSRRNRTQRGAAA